MYVLEILFGGVIVVPLIKALGGIALLLLWMRLPLALETAFFFGCCMCWKYLNLTALCVLEVMQLKSPTTFYSMTPWYMTDISFFLLIELFLWGIEVVFTLLS